MLILPKLEVPLVPLTRPIDGDHTEQIYAYLQTLVGYFYTCNAPLIEQNQLLPYINLTGFAPSNEWQDGIATTIAASVNITTAYTGGNLTFKINRRSLFAAGTAVMSYTINRLRDGAAVIGIAGVTPINFTPGDLNSHVSTITLINPGVLPNDTVTIEISRDGGNVGDTIAGSIVNDGISFSVG